MKMARWMGSVAVAAALTTAGTAMADGFVRMSDGGSGFNGLNPSGGAFVANTASPGGYIGIYGGPTSSGAPSQTTAFLTFCVERNENVTLGNATSGNNNKYYGKIRTGAVNGGNFGGNPDPISEATALLYSSFRRGQLIDGVSVDGNTSIVRHGETLAPGGIVSALQFAIWYLENEFGADNTPTATHNSFPGQNIDSGALNTAYKKLAADFVNWARSNAQAGNFYNVRVLQLWGYNGSGSRDDAANYTNNVQDQLTMIPLPPAGWAGLATLGCAVGVGYIRRRRLQTV